MEKDKTIEELLKWLEESVDDDFVVVDHWDADLCAIGISTTTMPQKLVYISTYNQRPESYDVIVETALENQQIGCVSREELLKILQKVLGLRLSY
ncbi:MAG: hypothetical protein EA357_00290 [Micavibrio sp.]|nr:MAG: hypothetical protein EA357_00290 [Micavibrio sp.]